MTFLRKNKKNNGSSGSRHKKDKGGINKDIKRLKSNIRKNRRIESQIQRFNKE